MGEAHAEIGKSTWSDEVADLPKVGAGEMGHHVEFPLSDPMERVAAKLAPEARRKGLAFKAPVEEGVPNRLRGDPDCLGQVLMRLGDNAVKFTEHGCVSIRACLLESSQPIDGLGGQARMLRFEVFGTGPWISPEVREELFGSSQETSSGMHDLGGTALGFVPTHQLVELMGGTIGVEPDLGVGTTLWLMIPLAPATKPQLSTTPSVAVPNESLGSGAVPNESPPVSANQMMRDEEHGPPSTSDAARWPGVGGDRAEVEKPVSRPSVEPNPPSKETSDASDSPRQPLVAIEAKKASVEVKEPGEPFMEAVQRVVDLVRQRDVLEQANKDIAGAQRFFERLSRREDVNAEAEIKAKANAESNVLAGAETMSEDEDLTWAQAFEKVTFYGSLIAQWTSTLGPVIALLKLMDRFVFQSAEAINDVSLSFPQHIGRILGTACAWAFHFRPPDSFTGALDLFAFELANMPASEEASPSLSRKLSGATQVVEGSLGILSSGGLTTNTEKSPRLVVKGFEKIHSGLTKLDIPPESAAKGAWALVGYLLFSHSELPSQTAVPATPDLNQ